MVAVERPIWMIGDSAFDILNWHDLLLEHYERESDPSSPNLAL
jgi:hypothetical protein